MNKARRKELQKMYDALMYISERLEALKEDEENTLESIPENLQGTECYEQCERAIDAMEEAIDSITSASEWIEDVING